MYAKYGDFPGRPNSGELTVSHVYLDETKGEPKRCMTLLKSE